MALVYPPESVAVAQMQQSQTVKKGNRWRNAWDGLVGKAVNNPTYIDDGLGNTPGREIKWPRVQYPERQGPGVQYPVQPKSYYDLYEMAKQETIFRTCMNAIRKEIFRNGIIIEPKFWAKCNNPKCKKEYKRQIEGMTISEFEFRTKGLECPTCEKGRLMPPDPKQEQILKDFYNKVNDNDMHLLDLLESMEDDLQIADNCYIILIKEYDLDEKGNIVDQKVLEAIRGHPVLMRVVADTRGHRGHVWWTCLDHRNFITAKKNDRCPTCGRTVLHEVWYVATFSGGQDIDQAYIEGEVIQESKYRRGELYGYSIILTLWHYLIASLVMIQLVADYYRERRWPAGVLVYPTLNPKSMEELADKWREKTKKDKLYIPWLNVDPNNANGRVEFVRLMDNLQEMQYTEVRAELGRRIGTAMGVEPFMTGDMSTGGGLNNEGLQVKVSNRAVKYDQQRIWNQSVIPRLCKGLGVTDYTYTVVESEEEDEMAKKERRAVDISNARTMFEMGFIGELDDNDNFIFPRKPMKQVDQYGVNNQFSPKDTEASNTQVPGDEQKKPTAGKDSQSEADDKEQEKQRAKIRQRETTHNDRQTGDPKEYKPASPTESKVKNPASALKSIEPENIIKTPINDVASTELYNRIVDGLRVLINTEIQALKVTKGDNVTKDDVLQVLGRIKDQMVSNVDGWAFKFFAAMYIYGKKSVLLTGNELDNAHNTLTSILDAVNTNDQDVLDAMELLKPFRDHFKDFSITLSNQFRQLIEDTFRAGQSKSIDEVVGQMQNLTTEQSFKLDRIARSESQNFVLSGREQGYKKIEEERGEPFLYIWSVYHDDRNSRQCPEIQRRVQLLASQRGTAGIPLEDLRQIVIQVQRDMNGPNWTIQGRGFLAHPNCRSRFIRTVDV